MKRQKFGFLQAFIFILMVTICSSPIQKVNAKILPGDHEPTQISASSQFSASWIPNYANDGNVVSAWSSIGYPSEDVSNANGGMGVYITYQFGIKKPMTNYVAMISRRIGNISYGFPKDFEVWILSKGTWSKARTITNCPNPNDDDDILVFTFENGKVYDVSAIRIRAFKLRPDNFGNFYFQLAELSAGYDPKLRFFKLKGHDENHNTRLTIQGAAGKQFNPDLDKIKHPIETQSPLYKASALNWYMVHDIRNFENPDLWMVAGFEFDQFGVFRDSGQGKNRNIYPQSVIAYDNDLGKYWIIYFGGWYGGYSDDESFKGKYPIARDKIFYAITKDFAKFSRGKLILEPGPHYEHINNPHVVTRGEDLFMIATTGNQNDALLAGYESRNPVFIGEVFPKNNMYAEDWYHFIEFDSPYPPIDMFPISDRDVPSLSNSPYPTIFPRDEADTFPHCNSTIPFVWDGISHFHAYYMDEQQVGSHNGSQTTSSVKNPGKAFDRDDKTSATIPYFWGEKGNYDFLHFVAFVMPSENTFSFNLKVSKSYPSSKMLIEGRKFDGTWELLNTFNLNTEVDQTVEVRNAYDYVDANNYINLRARWVDGDSGHDLEIKKIWSERKRVIFYHMSSKDLKNWVSVNHYDEGLRYGDIMDVERLLIRHKPIMHLYRGFQDVRFNMFKSLDDVRVENQWGRVLFFTNPYSTGTWPGNPHSTPPRPCETCWTAPDSSYDKAVFSNGATATIVQDHAGRFMGTLWGCSAAYDKNSKIVVPTDTNLEIHRNGICATWYQKRFVFTPIFVEKKDDDIHYSHGYDISYVDFDDEDRIESVSLDVFDGEDPKYPSNAEYSIEKITIIGGDIYEYTKPVFADVPPGFWAEDHIDAIFNEGITQGCSQNPFKYCPEKDVTREQMAAFIVRAVEGEPDANYCDMGSPFSDVSSASLFCKYIKRLSELGITQGCGGGKFCPKDVVTRNQMAAFLVRAVEGEPPANYCDTGSPFSDVPPSGVFCKYIKRLSELGITKGCGGGNYCPKSTVKRDQMAVFLGRAFLGMK